MSRSTLPAANVAAAGCTSAVSPPRTPRTSPRRHSGSRRHANAGPNGEQAQHDAGGTGDTPSVQWPGKCGRRAGGHQGGGDRGRAAAQQLPGQEVDRRDREGGERQGNPPQEILERRPRARVEQPGEIEAKRWVRERDGSAVPGDGRRYGPVICLQGANHGDEEATVIEREACAQDGNGADHQAHQHTSTEEPPIARSPGCLLRGRGGGRLISDGRHLAGGPS